MKTWKRALALVLALVMALSLVALPSFAAGGDEETGSAVTDGSTSIPGLELRKVYDPETSQLTLEAYATGTTTTTTTKTTVDIVLVLDVSGSMKDYMETYSISPNGTYYYKNWSGFQRAYYCSSCGGWFTSEHNRNHNSDIRLSPKTSANGSGTQFYSDVTKITALKDAVSTFIDNVATKSPDSSIAIVKFASDKVNDVGNGYTKRSGYNYSQIVQNLTTVNEAGASSLKTAVNQLTAAGATRADYGMQHAQTIINDAEVKNNGHQKVVIMFTDGQPTSGSSFEDTVANDAIQASESIKDAGATVYTIGCFGKTYKDTENVPKYMNYVSSNYPEATNMNNGGTRGVGDYYKTVSSASELESIFTEIAHTAGGATLELGTETVLKDVVSEYFDLPANAGSLITAKSYSCTELDASGNPIWSATPDDVGYNVEVNGKTVTVKGFDYSNNWVGKNTTSGEVHPGKKLVVTIPIVDNGTGMGEVPTNAETSAVYDGEKLVCSFAVPTANFPYFTVTHIQSNVDDNGKNYGKDAGFTKHRVPTDGTKFNLTSVVTDGYLYGGSFTNELCTEVQTYDNGENPTAFTPAAGEIYYIWEVPDIYIRPFAYWVSRHLEGGNGAISVIQLYLLAAVDRVNYLDAGFHVSFGEGDSGYDVKSGCEQLTAKADGNTLGQTTVYQMLEAALGSATGEIVDVWYLLKGEPTNQASELQKPAGSNPVDNNRNVIDDGCILGHRLTDEEFKNFKSNTVTYRPYWVTLDGVRVDGLRDRTYSFVENSKSPHKVGYNKFDAKDAYTFDGTGTQAVQTLSLRTNMLAGESEPAVENVNVTVVDAGRTYQLAVAPGGSVRDQVAYQAPAGKVFAGWFADQAYTTPADLDQVTQDATIYAKYVSDSYLDLDYSRTGLFRLRGVTLISAVDNPGNYQASGFIVNGQKVDASYASRYLIFKTPASLFGAARDAKLMLADYSKLSSSGTLEVTPYWVTLDGTEVLGSAHTLHYNTRTIWE